ncbi:hypothetical protein MRQ36_00500 [Micromonospora sp. R77]|uniref:hypothetical protein n=1 Tax=Micromonospora sp. R77 TaxID=2925836 RepID=UPI001F6188A6|nr:hypothetical protein [Micromonospora sp. R77]MCI4061130.1 hypothetical protein [Micromonospora sp. R77]
MSTLQDALARYAARLHAAAGPGHHVTSPLGAWLLLALCAPAASGGERDALADVLDGPGGRRDAGRRAAGRAAPGAGGDRRVAAGGSADWQAGLPRRPRPACCRTRRPSTRGPASTPA